MTSQVERDEDGNYKHSEPFRGVGLAEATGLIGGMEARIDTLEDYVAELQEFIGVNAPVDNDHVHHDPILQYEFCHQCLPTSLFPDPTVERLIKTLQSANKGLKPGATTNQQNIAYYDVRGTLHSIGEKE